VSSATKNVNIKLVLKTVTDRCHGETVTDAELITTQKQEILDIPHGSPELKSH
jgi:hypothetical protein